MTWCSRGTRGRSSFQPFFLAMRQDLSDRLANRTTGSVAMEATPSELPVRGWGQRRSAVRRWGRVMREASRFYVYARSRGGKFPAVVFAAWPVPPRYEGGSEPLNRKPACSPAPLLPPHFPTRARPCIAPTSFPLPLCRRQKLWPPPMPL